MANSRPRVPAQNDLVRELNRQIVLQVLAAAQGPSTRTGIAHATGLSVPTVNTIVNEFVEKGVVREVGAGPPAGGRPAQQVLLEPRSRLVLALDLNGPRVRAGLIDLRGETVEAMLGPVPEPGFEQALVSFLTELLARWPEAGRIGRLAFAVPGVVDRRSGQVRLAPSLGWEAYPFAAMIEERFDIPVTLENDVNALTLAELHDGLGREHRYVVCVSIADGIGAGLVVDGRLYRGAMAAAGEIGYCLTAGSGAASVGPLQLGSPGPFERHLSELSRSFTSADGQVELRSPDARAAFDAFADEFGVVMHNLACMVNPEVIVIAWPADATGALAARVSETWRGPLPLTVRASTLGQDAALRGVARLALEELERDLCAGSSGGAPLRGGGTSDHRRIASGRASAPAGAVRRSEG